MSDSSPTAATVVDEHDLHFDPAGGANGSLYVCFARGGEPTLDLSAEVAALREAGLWSEQASKVVPEEHRDAYREQLELVAVVPYRAPGGAFALARFDHPKFPSDAGRWSAWLAHFDARHQRAAPGS